MHCKYDWRISLGDEFVLIDCAVCSLKIQGEAGQRDIKGTVLDMPAIVSCNSIASVDIWTSQRLEMSSVLGLTCEVTG